MVIMLTHLLGHFEYAITILIAAVMQQWQQQRHHLPVVVETMIVKSVNPRPQTIPRPQQHQLHVSPIITTVKRTMARRQQNLTHHSLVLLKKKKLYWCILQLG
jgi:hypothetical protein